MPADRTVHPYIPNSIPEVRAAMLEAIGASDVEELYAAIPERLRFRGELDLPPAFSSEAELVRHVSGLLDGNRSTRDLVSFLGGGCYDHHVPAVCDEINGRGEFLTAYAGEPYEDHGRFQALFEYTSMMAELLEMDVVNVPTYDGFQAAATSLRMAARITGRSRVVASAAIGRDKLSKIRDYVTPDVRVDLVPFDPASGTIDVGAIEQAIDDATAAVYFENPSYLGTVEVDAAEVVALAHRRGALAVVSVDPSTLGVLAPPASYGADIACGDIQPLGMHQQFGGGHAGFIASADDPRIVLEYPSRLFGVAPTRVPGEYGFGDVAYERTSFALREEGKEWVGTAAALWGITAGVYLALMGPAGMTELGESMMARTRFLIEELASVPGVSIPFRASHHVKEVVVDFSPSGLRPAEVNRRLRERGILGGAPVAVAGVAAGPDVGGARFANAALYAVTEARSHGDLARLVDALREVLA